jgi:hypothetical protein
MTKTKIERSDLLEIAAMRARWKEERAAGATGETFARWRVRIKGKVLDELRKVLDDDRRRWPDPRKRDLGKPERHNKTLPSSTAAILTHALGGRGARTVGYSCGFDVHCFSRTGTARQQAEAQFSRDYRAEELANVSLMSRWRPSRISRAKILQ